MLTQVLPAAVDSATARRGPVPHAFGSTWCKPVLLLGTHVVDPGRRAGRQVTFHVSPRPGQAPTSRPALGNFLLPHFQPKPHLSLTLCPSRKWGSVSPNLSSALPRQRLLTISPSLPDTHTNTHTHTHTLVYFLHATCPVQLGGGDSVLQKFSRA